MGGRGRRRRRGPRRGRRAPRRRTRGRRSRRRLPSRAHRRRAPAPMARRPHPRERREGGGMKDPRVEALAQILVRYSTKVEPGDVTVIQSSTIAEPLVQAVYEEGLRAGGPPVFQIAPTGAQPAFYELAGDDQLDFVAPPQRWTYTDSDVRIALMAEANPPSPSRATPPPPPRAAPARRARPQRPPKPLLEAAMTRSAEGTHRWALTLYPTEAFA